MEKGIKQIVITSYTMFLWSLVVFSPLCSFSQNFLGISANVGSRLKYAPNSLYLKNPPSFSGSLSYVRQQKISSQWNTQFQGALGIMGFNLKVVTQDTISTSGSELVSQFSEYIIFYADIGTSLTRNFSIANRQAFFGLGGGATYYYCPFPTLEYGIDIVKDDNSEWNIFTSYMELSSKEIFGFASTQVGINLTRQLMFSLSYVHHFSPIMRGSYEFYHTANPSKGNLNLYQREVKLCIFWKVSRRGAKEK